MDLKESKGQSPEFEKLKKRIEEATEKFKSAENEKEKSRAFSQFTKSVDLLTSITPTTTEIDDYIFESIVKAKSMKKEISKKKTKEDQIDNFLRLTLLELEPEIKWGDIIGLKAHREIFLKQIILPLKTKKFENFENGVLMFGASNIGQKPQKFWNKFSSKLLRTNQV